MRLEYHFVSKGKLQAIDDEVNKIISDWPDSSIQRFQLWEMVAALELGIADKIFCHKGTILCHGWNGYNFDNYDKNKVQDPYRAWGGFYRLDKAGVGSKTYRFYLMWVRIEEGKLVDEEDFNEYFREIVSGNELWRFGVWVWEDAPDYIWGFRAWKSWHRKEDAEAQLRDAQEKFTHLKRGSVEYCDTSGCHFCTIEVSVNKPDEVNWHSVVRTRIRR